MNTKHKPATALPWNAVTHTIHHSVWAPNGVRVAEIRHCVNPDGSASVQDAFYIAHTANAYPELVEALINLLADADPDSANAGSQIEARALLSKLGEA